METELGEGMKISGFTIELLCCESTILNEIEHKECKRKDIALTYYFCMKSSENIDWGVINRAIIERWSFSGLEYIKNEAHKYFKKNWKAKEIGAEV